MSFSLVLMQTGSLFLGLSVRLTRQWLLYYYRNTLEILEDFPHYEVLAHLELRKVKTVFQSGPSSHQMHSTSYQLSDCLVLTDYHQLIQMHQTSNENDDSQSEHAHISCFYHMGSDSDYKQERMNVIMSNKLPNTGLNFASTGLNNPVSTSRSNLQQGIVFPKNHSSHGRLTSVKQMTKSSIRQQSPTKNDSEIHSLKLRIFEISKMMSEHSRQIQRLKEGKDSFGSYSSNDTLRKQVLHNEGVKSITKEMQLYRSQMRCTIMQEIGKVRSEILTSTPRKNQMEKVKSPDSLKGQATVLNLSKEFIEFKAKLDQDCRSLRDQLNHRLNNMHEANRNVFAQIQKDMKELNLRPQEQTFQGQLFSSNRKFYSPIMVKYKELMERVDKKGPTEAVVINQVTYYLDKQGYLLDSNFCYLVDRNNREVQLDGKHLNILNAYQLIR